MGKYQYPADGTRRNVFYHSFCNTAIDAFYSMHLLSEKIRSNEYYWATCSKEYLEIDEECNVVVVFSAMTIESLLNDFAASILGDAEFYDSFDRLSTIGKLDLISRFILHTGLDKSDSVYGSVKVLFRRRDYLVHNKSEKVNYDEIKKMARGDTDMPTPESLIESEAFAKIDKKEIKDLLRIGLDSIKAVKRVADFLTNHVTGLNITDSLFRGSYSLFVDDDYEKQKLKFIHNSIGLKVKLP